MYRLKEHKKMLWVFVLCLPSCLKAQQLVGETPTPQSAVIISPENNSIIYTDAGDFALIQKSGLLLQQDIERVTDKKPELLNSLPAAAKNIIIIGSIEKSSLIRQLIQGNKINVDKIKNKWEAYQVQIVAHPFKGIENAVVIVGSDRRGAAYGVVELSQQMGISPWYWWADVPVKKKSSLYIKKGLIISGAPTIKYRGIFINDEAPALSGWSKEKFGGFNHLFYEKVFELMLRLKANYLWPAMWGNAFYDDDSLNKQTADNYGIVIGTSHHEPLMRAHDEWKRYGSGKWNYDSNEIRLKKFWREGMQRVQGTETIVSVGMRGDGDEPMTQGVAIALLERIVKDQRQIIQDVTRKDPSATPQLWALYKEVQDYYDKGMRVPDDITLLLCDDNWGNIRKLPVLNEKKRSGGYGIYYHFDYVGDPRNYKWINTNNIARVWEQMHLAYEYGVDKIWIVNVGDLKPMEFPISFFLDYAWDTGRWNEDNLDSYYTNWAKQQFGDLYAKQIGEIIKKYTQYNARRKPELLSPETYSLFNYNETDNVINDYRKLVDEAERINLLLSPEYKDAFFELVLHPVKASANLNELYITVAKNKWYAEKKMVVANMFADRAKQLYVNDSLISFQYNHILADGKWNHMMDQTHIGYTYWQQPPVNKMPEVEYVPQDQVARDEIKIDTRTVTAEDIIPGKLKENVFYEKDGYVSIQAAHFTKVINTQGIQWKIIPGIGRDGSGITTFPVTSSLQSLPVNGPRAEYDFFVYDSGMVTVNAYFSPTLNFHNNEGLKYAVSIDDEQPQIISINQDGNNSKTWESWVADNIIIKSTNHSILKPGKHILKYRMIDAGVVLQKIVIDCGGMKPSYLGPPETIKK
ncbi:MAG: glycosyl hydrolase 115 family protein [Bacteroidota bacterium]